nr:hypothetical protein Q903MT_gene2549 [Picea sitchensis]
MVERLRSSPSCVGRACSSPLWSSYYVPLPFWVESLNVPHFASLLTDNVYFAF